MPEVSLFLLQAPLFLSLLLDLLSTSSRLYQHFFRWQHLSSVFSLLTLSLSLHFLFPLFPTFSLLFTAFFPPFCSFLFSSFTFSPSTSFRDSICSTRTSLLLNSGLFANSNEFDVRSYFFLYVYSIFPSGQHPFD